MEYRREIDGLRALAVVPVILFHAGFELFSGGYVGVDVFFVISGYLITTIIISEIQLGQFSFASFYERRARRILPAMFFVVLACLPFAWLWMFPDQFVDFAQSVVAVALFSSNILFWAESDYFAAAAELKPLLHTWSLAVEEQYYLFFPPLLIALSRLGKRTTVSVLVLIGAGSLYLSWWGINSYQTATFYLLPTRLWELLIGSLCAFYLFYRKDEVISKLWQNEIMAGLGLLLILIPTFTYRHDTPFPGLYALPPTLGTALLVLFCEKNTFAARLLSTRPFVGIGLISYSAYLWHQPLFAFIKIRRLEPPGDELMLLTAALSILLAYLTWRYVEKPFRNRSNFSRSKIFNLSLIGSVACIALGGVLQLNNGFAHHRFSEDQLDLISYLGYDKTKLYREGTCFLTSKQTSPSFAPSCTVITKNNGGNLFLWGDSHAAALSSGLRGRETGLSQYTSAGCPPLLNVRIHGRLQCQAINEHILDRVARVKPAMLILHANWYRYKGLDLRESLADTFREIRAVSPATQIRLVGSSVQWPSPLVEFMVRRDLSLENTSHLETSMFQVLSEQDAIISSVTRATGVDFISLLDFLCESSACITAIKIDAGIEPIVWDKSHLTKSGAALIADYILDNGTM